MKIQFLGAIRQVTGSHFYLETESARTIIDCGMFQERDYLGRNWVESPLPLADIDATLLTHAHLDHCGLLPKLVHEGLRCPVRATPASADLVEIVLRDSAKIQAEDAAFKIKRHQKEGRRGPYPPRPLYTDKDVDRTIPLLKRTPYRATIELGTGLHAQFHDAGHILGSAMIEVEATANGAARTVVFSGDIGQWDRPLIRDPSTFRRADYVVMESTYGDRVHEDHSSVEEQLAKVVNSTVEMDGKLIVPVFAIERAQELIYYLGRLIREKRIPALPVILDSPMASDVIEVFRRHRDCFDDEANALWDSGHSPLGFPGLRTVRDVDESKGLNEMGGPAIIMATSGMCTAGRIKHHLAHRISNPRDTVLFVGYQARGTLGRQILDGRPEVRIHGHNRLVRARVLQIHGFSGHADRTALIRWLSALEEPPRHVFVCHGDEPQALLFAEFIRTKLGWSASVPRYMQTVTLD